MPQMIGADAGALRLVAQTFTQTSERFAHMRGELEARIVEGDWRGTDADSFRQQWNSNLRGSLEQASRMLAEGASELRRQADEQERTSAPGGAEGGGLSLAPGDHMDRDNSDPNDDGTLDPRVAQQWAAMDTAERRYILNLLAQEMAAKYDIDVNLVVIDLDDSEGDSRGVWLEDGRFRDLGEGRRWYSGHTLAIDIDNIDNPQTALNVVAHEMRHAAQHEMVRDADPGPIDSVLIGLGVKDDPWHYDDVTREQAREWGRNFDDYKTAEDDGWDAYFDQPVEVDARIAGHNFVEDMTPERMAELREQYAAHRQEQENLPRPSPTPGPAPQPPKQS